MEISNGFQWRECKKHGPYQAKITEILGREMASLCPMCQDEHAAQEIARAERARAEAHARRIESLFNHAGIPPRFKDRSFDNYEITQAEQERALRTARNYADSFEDKLSRGTCLILSGKAGTGKTHLASAVANTIMKNGHSALFTTVSDAMRAIKRTYAPDSTTSEADAIRTFVEPALLILDEVGGSKGTEHEMQLLFDIVNKRYEHSKPIILMTNLDAVALREHLGDRVTDRLREGGGKLITFTWASHRA